MNIAGMPHDRRVTWHGLKRAENKRRQEGEDRKGCGVKCTAVRRSYTGKKIDNNLKFAQMQ